MIKLKKLDLASKNKYLIQFSYLIKMIKNTSDFIY
jgi:hypothetical protein